MNWILSWLFRISGWKVLGELPDLNKYVVIVAPHTSSWDFIIGVLARSHMKMNSARFLGKKELFDGPFGWFFRTLGGYGVDRKSAHQVVDQVVEAFKSHEHFILALAPEGTRKKVDKLRTGFYYMALGAGVPIQPIGMDFQSKSIIIGNLLNPSGNLEADMKIILSFFNGIKGKNPDQGISF
jgi:1-acyl-sn-glycerol-3-phosphate acyltransferase